MIFDSAKRQIERTGKIVPSSAIIKRRSKVLRLQMLAYSQKQYEKVAQAKYLINQLDKLLLTNLQN